MDYLHALCSPDALPQTSLRQCFSPHDFDQEPAIPLDFLSLDNGQPHPHTSIRQRLSGTGRPSSAVNCPQENISGFGSSSGRRTLDILGDSWEVDCGPDSFPLDTISEWATRTEGELDDIFRRFENHNDNATDQVCP